MAASSAAAPQWADPGDAEIARHYAHACPPSVAVRFLGPERGKGLVATRSFGRGEVVFRERKLVGRVSEQARREFGAARLCEHCGRFLVSARAFFREFLQAAGRDVADAARLAAPGADDAPAPVPCARAAGGCERVFCSTACRDTAEMQYHQLLCRGLRRAGALVAEFEEHCARTNETFEVAAKLVAMLALRVRRGGVSLRQALEPLALLHRGAWWDVVAMPRELRHPKRQQAFLRSLRELAEASAALLEAALREALKETAALGGEGLAPLPPPPPGAPPPPPPPPLETWGVSAGSGSGGGGGDSGDDASALFDPGLFATLMGAFERNNWATAVNNPAGVMLDRLGAAQRAELQRALGDDGYDALVECSERFAEGAGLYLIGANANHSCAPNAALLKDGDADDTTAVIAVRRIAAGEEVTVSYIEEQAPLRRRQEALRDYGFACRCARCERERVGGPRKAPRERAARGAAAREAREEEEDEDEEEEGEDEEEDEEEARQQQQPQPQQQQAASEGKDAGDGDDAAPRFRFEREEDEEDEDEEEEEEEDEAARPTRRAPSPKRPAAADGGADHKRARTDSGSSGSGGGDGDMP